jgi:hypothetical protein
MQLFYYRARRFIPAAPRSVWHVAALRRILADCDDPTGPAAGVAAISGVIAGVRHVFRCGDPLRAGPSHRKLQEFRHLLSLIWCLLGCGYRPPASQAIAAITDGIVPAVPTVRYAAMRLGSAYLGAKAVDALKRRERSAWIATAIILALLIAWAVAQSSGYAIMYYLGLIVAISLPLALLRGRRIQRNFALLTEACRRGGMP